MMKKLVMFSLKDNFYWIFLTIRIYVIYLVYSEFQRVQFSLFGISKGVRKWYVAKSQFFGECDF